MADDNALSSGYINPVTGDPMTPDEIAQQGSLLSSAGRYAGHVAQGIGDLVSTPGTVMQPNPYPPGSEAAIMYDDQRQQAIAQWGPQMATTMVGTGTPMAEAGALGAGGGALRNKFTGAFKKADAGTDLPKNQMYTNAERAQAIAENSANAKQPGFPSLVQNTPIDPALVSANLQRLANPISEAAYIPPTAAERVASNMSKLGSNEMYSPANPPVPPQGVPSRLRIDNPWDVDYHKQKTPNSFIGETEKHILKTYGMAGLSMLPPATAAFLSQRMTPVDHDPFSGT